MEVAGNVAGIVVIHEVELSYLLVGREGRQRKREAKVDIGLPLTDPLPHGLE
jgi:hypothetical protein